MAATNRPDIIDDAVLRPERLGTHLYVPVPTQNDRHEILKTLTRTMPLEKDINLEEISNRKELDSFTGADLRSLCENAAMSAAWSKMQSKMTIEMDDFEVAILKTKSSIKGIDLSYYEKLQKIL